MSTPVSGAVSGEAHGPGMRRRITQRPLRRPHPLSTRLTRRVAEHPPPPSASWREPGGGVSPTQPFSDLGELLVLAGFGRRRQPRPTRSCGASSTSPTTTSWPSGSCCERLLPGLLAIVRKRPPVRSARVAGGADRRGLPRHPRLRHGTAAASGRRQPRARRRLPGVHRAAAAAVGVGGVHRSPRPRRDAGRRRDVRRRGAGPAAGRGAELPGIDQCDLDLFRALLRHGSPSIVAAERKVTTRTIRNHRDRTAARIRQVALAA